MILIRSECSRRNSTGSAMRWWGSRARTRQVRAVKTGRGWRRMMPSPRPVEILEEREIRVLAAAGTVVIAAGGGGIPMVHRADGSYAGVPAVVDKDFTSALLANGLGIDTLMILTAVRNVAVRFGKARLGSR